MRQATPQMRDLARRLFAREAEKKDKPPNAADTMGKVCAKLFQRLNLLIGEGGFHAIVKRSLNLTTSEFPWVTDVKIEQHPACSFTGLHESIEGRDSAEASEGFAAITANIIYVVSYHTNTGFYGVTEPGLTTAVDHTPLHALSDTTAGGNGVYAYSAGVAFPNQTFDASNYWVDVVFTPR